MRIAITNTVALNGGDAAILVAMVALLRREFGAVTHFDVFDAQSDVAARYYSRLDFHRSLYEEVCVWQRGTRRRLALAFVLAACWAWRGSLGAALRRRLPSSLRESLEIYARADLIVSTGGTYLVPNYRLMPKIYDFFVALALRRPLVLFTQSLGPFPDGRDRLLLGFALRRARLILVRDERSRQHLLDLGVDRRRIVVSADAAFALARPSEPPVSVVASNRPPAVAVSVRDWPNIADGAAGMERYLDAVTGFVTRIVREHGASVTFLSTCQGIPEYWTDDSRTASLVVDRLPGDVRERVELDRQFRSPEQLIERFSAFDVIVATRMHAAILALCSGVPVVPVAYEFKTAELFDRLGFKHLVQDIETVTAEDLLEACRTVFAESAQIRSTLSTRVASERDLAASGPRWIRQAVMAAA